MVKAKEKSEIGAGLISGLFFLLGAASLIGSSLVSQRKTSFLSRANSNVASYSCVQKIPVKGEYQFFKRNGAIPVCDRNQILQGTPQDSIDAWRVMLEKGVGKCQDYTYCGNDQSRFWCYWYGNDKRQSRCLTRDQSCDNGSCFENQGGVDQSGSGGQTSAGATGSTGGTTGNAVSNGCFSMKAEFEVNDEGGKKAFYATVIFESQTGGVISLYEAGQFIATNGLNPPHFVYHPEWTQHHRPGTRLAVGTLDRGQSYTVYYKGEHFNCNPRVINFACQLTYDSDGGTAVSGNGCGCRNCQAVVRPTSSQTGSSGDRRSQGSNERSRDLAEQTSQNFRDRSTTLREGLNNLPSLTPLPKCTEGINGNCATLAGRVLIEGNRLEELSGNDSNSNYFLAIKIIDKDNNLTGNVLIVRSSTWEWRGAINQKVYELEFGLFKNSSLQINWTKLNTPVVAPNTNINFDLRGAPVSDISELPKNFQVVIGEFTDCQNNCGTLGGKIFVDDQEFDSINNRNHSNYIVKIEINELVVIQGVTPQVKAKGYFWIRKSPWVWRDAFLNLKNYEITAAVFESSGRSQISKSKFSELVLAPRVDINFNFYINNPSPTLTLAPTSTPTPPPPRSKKINLVLDVESTCFDVLVIDPKEIKLTLNSNEHQYLYFDNLTVSEQPFLTNQVGVLFYELPPSAMRRGKHYKRMNINGTINRKTDIDKQDDAVFDFSFAVLLFHSSDINNLFGNNNNQMQPFLERLKLQEGSLNYLSYDEGMIYELTAISHDCGTSFNTPTPTPLPVYNVYISRNFTGGDIHLKKNQVLIWNHTDLNDLIDPQFEIIIYEVDASGNMKVYEKINLGDLFSLFARVKDIKFTSTGSFYYEVYEKPLAPWAFLVTNKKIATGYIYVRD